MLRTASAIVASAAFLLLSACAVPLQTPKYPQLSYAHLPPLTLDVARVEVMSRYISPAHLPNVEHEFPVSPANAAMQWGRDRIKAGGVNGTARVVVERASVVEVPLKRTTGVRGAFTADQTERYDAILEIKVEVLGEDGKERASVSSTTRRSRSVGENITLNEREKVWFEMTEAMMNDLNASLEGQIREHMKPYLR